MNAGFNEQYKLFQMCALIRGNTVSVQAWPLDSDLQDAMLRGGVHPLLTVTCSQGTKG